MNRRHRDEVSAVDELSGSFLSWLRGFYYTAKYGGVSAAAARLGLQQPAVSYQIRALEEELRLKLFRRTPRAMQLTEEGQQLLERCMPLFELLREIREEVGRDSAAAYRGALSVVTTHSVAQHVLPDKLHDFSNRYPEVRFNLTSVTESSRILDAVMNGEADMGIGQGRHFPVSIEARPLFVSRLSFIVAKQAAAQNGWHCKTDERGFLTDLRQLAGIPAIQLTAGTRINELVCRALELQGVSLPILLTANTSIMLKRYVQEGLGGGIIDSVALHSCDEDFDVYPMDIEGSEHVYHLLTRRNRYISAQAKGFMQHLLNLCSQLPKEGVLRLPEQSDENAPS